MDSTIWDEGSDPDSMLDEVMDALRKNIYNAKKTLTLYLPGYFYNLFVPERGGKFAPQSKNRLVSDICKIFCLLKLFFVKCLKINILRLWRLENYDDVIKTSQSL